MPSTGPDPGIGSSREHLEAALRRLGKVLRLGLARRRWDAEASGFNEFRGLVITDEEIENLWRAGEAPPAASEAEVAALRAELEAAEKELAEGTARALAAGVRLPLVELARRFDLAPFDLDALLVCLAPDLDLKFEKLYAYLNNDVTRKRPTVDLILKLVCQGPSERLIARRRLASDAPLLDHQLLVWEPVNPEPAFLARQLRADDRIVDYLLELPTPDAHLAPFLRDLPGAEPLLPPAFLAGLERLFAERAVGARGEGFAERPRFVFHGPAGTGRAAAARALCRRSERDLLRLEAPHLLAAEGEVRDLARRLFREARLRDAAVYLDGAEALLGRAAPGSWSGGARAEVQGEDAGPAAAGNTAAAREVLVAMADFPGPVFLASEVPWPPSLPGDGGAFCRVEFPRPDRHARRELWRAALAAHGLVLDPDVDLEALADHYAFGADKIARAAAEARHRATFASHVATATPTLSRDDLDRVCRAQANDRLSQLARKITPLYTWDDIVLPPERLAQLQEICIHVRQHRRVFEGWGFSGKIARGKGVSVLLLGPSGSGKTMASEILARELGLELYKIDLSSVVSKYIGETEKNLARIFREAEESPVVLFFDEADALFGKRSQVKDAHDRYANIEINYLLQRMEEHEGVVILASNFKKNIDGAFTRRLRFVIELPMPDEVERRQIWERMFPDSLPRTPNLDFDFLASRLKLTGGHIKNIVLAAAFMAAEQGSPVAMPHLIRATQREFQKTGRMCVKSDFGPYFHLLANGHATAARAPGVSA